MICLQQIMKMALKGIVLAFHAVEAIGSLIVTGQQIETAVLNQKIINVVDQHRKEFEFLAKIDKLFQSLSSNAILTNALMDTGRISLMNWKVIADNLNQTVRIMDDLTANYKDVNLTNHQMTLKSGLNFSLSILASGMALNNFSKKFLGGQNVQDSNKKLRGKMQKEKIVRCQLVIDGDKPINLGDGEIKLTDSGGKPKGSVKQVKVVEVTGNIKSSFKAPKNSVFTKIHHYGSKIGKGIMKVLRVVGMAGMMYAIRMGDKRNSQLIQTYNEVLSQYGEGGKFKKSEVQILNTMTSVAELLTNLGYASYAAIIDISNSSLICGLTFSSFNEHFLEQAAKFNPDKMGVGLDYCESALKLFNDLALINVNDHSSDQQFQKALSSAHDMLQKFIRNYDPMTKNTHLAKTFINSNSTLSLFNQNNLSNEYIVNDFKKSFLDSFNRRNASLTEIQNKLATKKIDQKKADEEKQARDKVLVMGLTIEYILKVYNIRSGVYPLSYDELMSYSDIFTVVPEAELNILGNIILSFTNTIFSESLAGNILFKKAVNSYKTNTTYKLFNQTFTSAPNTIPMPKLEEPKETKEINEFNAPIQALIKQSKMIDINDPKKFLILEKIRVAHMNFLIGHVIINGKKHDRIEFRKGIVIHGKVKQDNMSKFYIVSQSTINNEWAVSE